jgi:hypothetical protein
MQEMPPWSLNGPQDKWDSRTPGPDRCVAAASPQEVFKRRYQYVCSKHH